MELNSIDLFSAKLLDKNEKPTDGVKITTYKSHRRNQVYASTQSDSNGMFKIALPDGEERVSIALEKKGFIPIRKIYLRSGIKHLNTLHLTKD